MDWRHFHRLNLSRKKTDLALVLVSDGTVMDLEEGQVEDMDLSDDMVVLKCQPSDRATVQSQTSAPVALHGVSAPIHATSSTFIDETPPRGVKRARVESAEPSVFESKQDKEDTRCFNCGSYSHALKDCPKPRDHVAISNARKQHNSKRNLSNANRGQNRYYQKTPGKFDDLKAGVLVSETRECLGPREGDPPPCTQNARIGLSSRLPRRGGRRSKPSGITIFMDGETKAENEEGELPEKGSPPRKKMTGGVSRDKRTSPREWRPLAVGQHPTAPVLLGPSPPPPPIIGFKGQGWREALLVVIEAPSLRARPTGGDPGSGEVSLGQIRTEELLVIEVLR